MKQSTSTINNTNSNQWDMWKWLENFYKREQANKNVKVAK